MKYIITVLLVLCMTAIAWAVTPVTKYLSSEGYEFDTASEAEYFDKLSPIMDRFTEEYGEKSAYTDIRRQPEYITTRQVAEFILKYYPPMNCNECHKGVTK